MNTDLLSLWEWIPLEKFYPPQEPKVQKVKRTLRDILFSLGEFDRKKKIEKYKELDPEKDVFEKMFFEKPKWPALDRLFEDRYGQLQSQYKEAPFTFTFLAIPESQLFIALHAWSKKIPSYTLTPPSFQEIINRDFSALENFDRAENKLLIIPDLSRWFVRHYRGLDLFRHLLDKISNSNRQIIIGCNIWAWSYFMRAFGIDHYFDIVETMQPFDAKKTHEFLYSQSRKKEKIELYEFDNDEPILILDEGNKMSASESRFLETLAYMSYGTPELIWELLKSLFTKAKKKEDSDKVFLNRKKLLESIEISSDNKTEILIILHTLFLHGEIHLAWLPTLLSLPFIKIAPAVRDLLRQKIIEGHQNKLKLALSQCPKARIQLMDENYIVGVPSG